MVGKENAAPAEPDWDGCKRVSDGADRTTCPRAMANKIAALRMRDITLAARSLIVVRVTSMSIAVMLMRRRGWMRMMPIRRRVRCHPDN